MCSPLRLTAMILLTALAVPSFAQPPGTQNPSPVHQLRTYEIFDHNKQAFHDRFRDHAAPIMARHGFEIVAMWESRFEDRTEFVYLLQWPDEKTMKARWSEFMQDEEWKRIKQETGARDGKMVGGIEDRTLHLTGYSPRADLLKPGSQATNSTR